jgi:hypothetical protein
MAQLSKQEFSEFVVSTLPDNSNREISALDLRNTFFNLADSVVSFLSDEKIVSKNFASVDLRSTVAGDTALSRINIAGASNVDNSALGYAALEFNYAGIRNTALGSYAASCNALGTDNVALGVHSLGSTTTGSGNLGLGNFSLMGNKFGNFNIAIGHGAGYVAPSDSEFKFYLGAYPQASGDCDDHVAGIDTPPLLYGDLKTLQLAIGASGFRGSEKLAVSGDILPYESGGLFSLGSGDYRWNAHIQDLYVSGNIFTGSEAASFYQYKITDGLSAADTISNDETVAISGISGILTDYSSNIMRVSAAPLSGVIDSQFTSLSGVEPSIFGPSGLIFHVSGAAFEYANAVGAAAGAYTHWKVSDGTKNNNITAPGNAANTLIFGGISGVTTNYRGDTNKLEISAHPLSGFVDFRFEEVSGKLNDISGVNGLINGLSGVLQPQITTNDSRASGLIHASGDYLLNLIYNSGDNVRKHADQVLIDAKAFTNSASGALRGAIADSGYLFSGILQSQINTNDSRTSGIFNALSGVAPSIFGPSGLIYHVSGAAFEYASNIATAAGSYVFWKLTDGSNEKEIRHSNTVRFVSEDGISTAYDSAASIFTIGASDLSGVLIKTSVANDANASGLISFTSGVLDRFIKSASGNVLSYSEDLSGVLRGEINDLTADTVGTIDQRIAASKTDIVNNIITPLDNAIHSQAGLSGTLQHDIDSVSGYTEDLNNFFDTRASGYINTLSGVIIDHDFFAFGGIVHKVSGVVQRYAKSLIDDFSDDLLEGDTGKWFVGDQTLADTKPISFNTTLNVVGKDGLTTFVGGDSTPFSLTVDASPISGYLEDIALEITGVQGCFESKIRAASGLALYVSGVAREAVGASGALISGWAHNSFLHYDNRASGNISHHSGILRSAVSDSGYFISGVLDSFIDLTSGNLDSYIDSVSGNLQDQFTSISGNTPSIFGPSGLIFHVSGASFEHTNEQIQALSIASDAYIHWRISDGTTVRNIRSLEETQFLGISGIETQTKTTGASGLSISARPISGVLHGIIGESGANILNYVKTDFFNDIVKPEISTVAGNLDTPLDNNASGLISFVSGVLDRYVDVASGNLDSYIDTVSGYFLDYIVDNDNRASGLIATNDTRASGYILAVSGATITSAGSGLVRLGGGEFNTAGSGNFERVILNQNGTHPSGQVVADSGREGVTQYHDIVNSSGYLVVPVRSQFEDLKTLNHIDPVNSGAIAFAGGHVRVANGLTWSKPPVVEGFMDEDLDAPTDYSNPTSGKLVTRNELFQASDTYYVTNRDHTFAASGGYFLMAMLVNNEYRPVWSTCSGCAS